MSNQTEPSRIVLHVSVDERDREWLEECVRRCQSAATFIDFSQSWESWEAEERPTT